MSRGYVFDELSRFPSPQNYAVSLAEQLGLKGPHTGQPLGRDLKEEDFEKLRDEQVCQLYELMIAATGKPGGTQGKT